MNTFGSVIPAHNLLQGHPSILNAEQRNELFNLLDQAPEMFLDELQDWVRLLLPALLCIILSKMQV